MTTTGRDNTFQFERGPLIVAAVMVAVGALIAWIGVAIGTRHAWSQGSRFVQTLDTGPAKARWQQLQQAAAAGASASADAWKKADSLTRA